MLKKYVSLCLMLVASLLSSIAQPVSRSGEAGSVRGGDFQSHKVSVPWGVETVRPSHKSIKTARPLLARRKSVPHGGG